MVSNVIMNVELFTQSILTQNPY